MPDSTPEHSEFVDRLRDLWAIIRLDARMVVAFTLVVFVLGAIATLATPKTYQSTALVHLVPWVGQEVQAPKVVDLDVRGFQEIERFYRTQLEILKTRSFAHQVLLAYQTHGYDDLDPDEDAAKLVAMIRTFPRERSQIIEVSVVHGDPVKAALLANLVASTYVEQNLVARREAAAEAQKWLKEKLGDYERLVSEASKRLLDFQAEHGLVDAGDGSGSLTARMEALDARYGEISTERVMLATRLRSYDQLLAEGEYAALAGVIDTPAIRELSAAHAEASTELAELAARYGPKHPEMRAEQARLDQIETKFKLRIREALAADKSTLKLLESQEQELVAEIDSTKAEIIELERLRADYAALQLDLTRTSDFQKTLSERADELALQSRTQLNNARVVDEATVPKRPIRPRVFLNLALALLAGLSGGAVFVVARAYLDETLTRPDDVETFLHAPLLGLVPHVPHPVGGAADDLYTWREPETAIAESVRSLRTMLELGPSGRKIRRILVTSSVASEGKTSTTVRIGIAFAEQGKRVCVVDCDHRRARLHKVFDQGEEQPGLLGILLGEATLEEAVQDTQIEGLHLLRLGSRSTEASRLLTSVAMEQLIEALSEQYDRVIIDSPPAAALSEAVHLSQMVDGVLMIVRSGRVSRNVVRHTLDRFRHVQANLLGVVLNDVSPDRTATGSHYYYGYGTLYGYVPYASKDDPDSKGDSNGDSKGDSKGERGGRGAAAK